MNDQAGNGEQNRDDGSTLIYAYIVACHQSMVIIVIKH